MAVNAIFGYLATLVERGEAIDLSPWLSLDDREHVHTALNALSEPCSLKGCVGAPERIPSELFPWARPIIAGSSTG